MLSLEGEDMKFIVYHIHLFVLMVFLLASCGTVPVTGRKQLALIPSSTMLSMSFQQYDAFLNLGGIVNISIHDDDNVIAYDLTVCNQALNYLTRQIGFEYDDRGKIAKSGQINSDLLISLNELEYLKQYHPKSLSNTWVIEKVYPLLNKFQIDTKDSLATVVEHISCEVLKSFL